MGTEAALRTKPGGASVPGGVITMATRKKRPTADAVQILYRRSYEGRPERAQGLEEARANDSVARKLTALRLQAGMTQRQLAKRAGTDGLRHVPAGKCGLRGALPRHAESYRCGVGSARGTPVCARLSWENTQDGLSSKALPFDETAGTPEASPESPLARLRPALAPRQGPGFREAQARARTLRAGRPRSARRG